MCGRYVSPDAAAIERAFHVGRASGDPLSRRFNVAPTSFVPLIRASAGLRELIGARWGFIPKWWTKAKAPAHCFNARAEDVATKTMWRDAYRVSRCLIPAEGWYEWQAAETTDPATGEIKPQRQPHYIFRPDRGLLCFAGLMSSWRERGRDPVLTCAILTRAAAHSLAQIHDRMPVVLPPASFDRWLDPAPKQPAALADIIASASAEFAHHPVSVRLNAAKVDDEGLTSPLP